MLQLLIALMTLPVAKSDVPEYPTEWYVTVTENEVPRTMNAVNPSQSDHPNDRFKFAVDQHLAPGWTCMVLGEMWRGNGRSRWMTCYFKNDAATVSVRTNCRADRSSAKSQEIWLGDKVAVELSCRSGLLP